MSYDYLFKLIVIGDPEVGKTAIVNQLTNRKFEGTYATTIGIDFAVKTILVGDGIRIKAHIWDTAGQECFSSIIATYYKAAAGVILVFDLTRYDSFARCDHWLTELNNKKGPDRSVPIILLGNKLDKRERTVTQEEAEEYAKQKSLLYMETSARTPTNIDSFYRKLIEDMYDGLNPDGENIGVKRCPPYIRKAEEITTLSIRECTRLKYDCCVLS